MKVESHDVIVGVMVIACVVLIAVFKETPAWGALVTILIAYLAKKGNGKAPPRKRAVGSKTMKRLVFIIILLALLILPVYPQCQSNICKGGDSCINNIFPYCRGGCSPETRCRVYGGNCSGHGQALCFARICVNPGMCGPNPNFASSATFSTANASTSQAFTVTFAYTQEQGGFVGSPALPSFTGATSDLYSSASWLMAHENFVRTDSLLGLTCYVHAYDDGQDRLEVWYATETGPLALKVIVKDGVGNVVVSATATAVSF